MQANRLLSLAVCVVLVAGCNSESGPPKQIELPVTRTPDRASNEETVEMTPRERAIAELRSGFTPPAPAASEKPSATRPSNAKAGRETALATTTPAHPSSANAAQNAAAPSATKVAIAKPRAATRPALNNYAAESFRFVNQSDEIVTTLKNGLVVVVKRVHSPVTAVRGYVKTGGVYEGKWLGGGLSHLLEHLVAGGSSQRRTEAQNRDLLQKIGNDSNAYTTDDHTAYFVNTTVEHLDEAADLVTGWMLGALITPDEYKREYEVVQRELEKDKGEPDWLFYELSQQNRYRVSPARVPTIGYQAVIQGLSRDDVYGYYKQTYQPNNMVFSITGDADPEDLLAAVQKFVGDVPPGRVPSHDIDPEPRVVTPRTTVATFPKLGQARLELSFPSVRMDSVDLYALDLLSTILGGGESSILVQELRDKQQLVSAISAGNPTPSYVEGSFQIDMELAPEKIGPATEAALLQLAAIVKNGIDADRLQRAKTQMRASRVRGLQKSENVAASMATDFLTSGDPHFTDVYLQRIEKVTPEQIKDIATRYFVRQRLLTTALLPAEFVGAGGLPRAEDLLRVVAPTTKDTTADAETPSVTRVELPNGAILLHKRLVTSPLVVIKMFSLGGVTAEDAKTNGLGNLTMEMLPRGTKTRSAQQIAEFFDSIGGELETSCGNNSWSWGVTCLKSDFDKAMEVLGDVVNAPSFADGEIAPMKQRIAAQIESQDADWMQQSMRFFKKSYFGPKNSPYQFLPTGTKENVAAFTREQARQWYADKVLQGRRVIAIFGDVDLDRAQKIARLRLGSGDPIKNKAAPTTEKEAADQGTATTQPSVDVKRVEVQKTEQPLAGVIIGYDSNSFMGDPANYSIDVADTMCSGYGYPTGYLHEILRGRGLVYIVHAQNWPGRSEKLPGMFFAYAGCDPTKVNEVVDIMLENIARLQGTEKDTQPGWFDRSKQLITTSDALENETPAEQAQTAALDELVGLGFDHHDQFSPRINAVTLDQVRQVCARRINQCVVTVSTPNPELLQIKAGKRAYESFPPVDLTPRGVQHDAK